MEAQFFSLLNKEDIKAAVIEALAETKSTPKTTSEGSKTIYGLKGLATYLGIGVVTAWKLKKALPIQGYHLLLPVFPYCSSLLLKATCLVRVRSSLLTESLLMSFPSANEIFRFPVTIRANPGN